MSVATSEILVLETVIHRADGEVEVYYERGDTPQSFAALKEKLEDYPHGRKELYQHGDGFLRNYPPTSSFS